MRLVIAVILGHVVVILALVALGRFANSVFQEYAGIATVLAVAVTVYSVGGTILYHRSRWFFFFVKRIVLRVRRTHSYWVPHVRMELAGEDKDRPRLLTDIWDHLSSSPKQNVHQKYSESNSLKVEVDQLFTLEFLLSGDELNISVDHRLLVPVHLYDDRRRQLGGLVELITSVVRPKNVWCSVRVEFDEGGKNPYYGFFVQDVPPGLLTSFQVAFQVAACSDCRVEASKEYVNVEGKGPSEVLDTLRQVLALRAKPTGC